MLLLAGLGNPGAKYAHNRHNIGFMAVDEIARIHEASAPRKRFLGETRDATIAGEKVVILKPHTFMNESGQSVGEAARFYKLAPEDIYVIHDELDLAPGKIRFKTGGGTAGNNGIKSIARHIGPDFNRIRIGIGHPGDRNKVHAYVLKDFPKSDRDWVSDMVDAIAKHFSILIEKEPASFINRIHLDLRPPEKSPSPDQKD